MMVRSPAVTIQRAGVVLRYLLNKKETDGRFQNPNLLMRGTPVVVPRSSETASSQDTTVGLCRGSYGVPRGWAFSYGRGTPADEGHGTRSREASCHSLY